VVRWCRCHLQFKSDLGLYSNTPALGITSFVPV
jgi:hypothetical protein